MKTLALAALVVFSLIALGGQAQTGMINGMVRDSDGAAMPGVTVTATNADNGKVTTLVTNQTGAYSFSTLTAGTYALDAALPGFLTKRVSGVVLGPSALLRQNFALTMQTPPSPYDRPATADIVADSQSRQGVVTSYRGHVRMTTSSTIITADELDFNSQTQHADVRGNVSVQVRPITPKAIPLAQSR